MPANLSFAQSWSFYRGVALSLTPRPFPFSKLEFPTMDMCSRSSSDVILAMNACKPSCGPDFVHDVLARASVCYNNR